MSEPPGMLTTDELATLVDDGSVDTVILAFPDLYGRLMGKRLDAGFFLDQPATHACDYLFTVDMDMEPVEGYSFANWEKGYGDVHLVPDLGTLRLASWLDRTALVVCDAEDDDTETPVAVAPRTILRRQVERAAADGYRAMAASELEYYLFRTSYDDAQRSGYRDVEPAGWYLEDYHLLQAARTEDLNGAFRRHLAQSGVPVESTKGEWGRGQHEVNYRYADVLTNADRHSVVKQCLKELSDQAGASVTFMAKWADDAAGSSCHLHLSLWAGEQNAFAAADGGPSDVFRWFLGGWLARVPEVMPLYAPTPNSYKRYQDGSWAPTRLGWALDNRTAAFRVVGRGPSLRIECRVPGADCNPYLALAAALVSGLDGVERQVEPPERIEGDLYAATDAPHVPATLADAVDRFEKSDFCRAAFGPEVVDHYTHFFRTEQAAYGRSVGEWERGRYFERI